jgi:alpha-glucosidase
MHHVMRYWLDRGVDGFRVDVIWHLIKDSEFRANPPNPEYRPGEWTYRQLLATYTTDRPEVHHIIGGMRAVMDEYQDRLMVGEVYLPVERLVTYYGAGGDGCHLPFNFQLIDLPWEASTIASVVQAYEAALPPFGWPNWVLGNHDKPRIASRVGREQARTAAMLLLTLRGTPTLYYGDEIGMTDVSIPPEAVQDPWEKNVPGLGFGRDPVRTPMHWDGQPQAGFTTGTPWLPVPPSASTVNVASEREDPTSILTLYRRLILLRRAEEALSIGSYRHGAAVGDVMLYYRERDSRRFLIALNFSDRSTLTPCPGRGTILLSTHLDRHAEPWEDKLELRKHEGVIVRLQS